MTGSISQTNVVELRLSSAKIFPSVFRADIMALLVQKVCLQRVLPTNCMLVATSYGKPKSTKVDVHHGARENAVADVKYQCR